MKSLPSHLAFTALFCHNGQCLLFGAPFSLPIS
jgi:hypothetical protein